MTCSRSIPTTGIATPSNMIIPPSSSRPVGTEPRKIQASGKLKTGLLRRIKAVKRASKYRDDCIEKSRLRNGPNNPHSVT